LPGVKILQYYDGIKAFGCQASNETYRGLIRNPVIDTQRLEDLEIRASN
jgi:hypothetical protein